MRSSVIVDQRQLSHLSRNEQIVLRSVSHWFLIGGTFRLLLDHVQNFFSPPPVCVPLLGAGWRGAGLYSFDFRTAHLRTAESLFFTCLHSITAWLSRVCIVSVGEPWARRRPKHLLLSKISQRARPALVDPMDETDFSHGTTSISCCTGHCRSECAPTITDPLEKANVIAQIFSMRPISPKLSNL